MSFTTTPMNPGGTGLQRGLGEKTHLVTKRLDELYVGSPDITFFKLDVEEAEEYVLHGMGSLLTSGRIRHLVMEIRAKQGHIAAWFFDLGYVCGEYDMVPQTKAALLAKITKLPDYMGAAARAAAACMRRRVRARSRDVPRLDRRHLLRACRKVEP